MKTRYLTTVILEITCLTTAKPLTADVSSLQDLLDGGTLTTTNTVFSNFELLSIGTSTIDPNQVSVETLNSSGGLNFIGNGELSLDAGDESIIFQLGFNASTSGPQWQSTGVDLSQGNASIGGFGVVDIFNSISDPNQILLAETNAVIDPGFGINVLSDDSLLDGPQSNVNFVSSFALFADSGAPTSIDSYQITLSVPEPGSCAALLFLSACTVLRRKR